ncbi:hypothetical protein TrRE_jg6413 [Triparma retinervis]|uniref:Uncharacterized protein n=1 Tax=Triparma retinervis TaxID=2557542 RepID=A0A9W7F7Z5_9STRA|nr:hypothetical protein TrRE_jg6413 [Triparma retinervis]
MTKQESVQREIESKVITRDHHELIRLCDKLGNHSQYSKRAPSIQLLLPKILDVDSFKTTKRRTALHHAVRTRRGSDAVDVVELLLNAGADPNYLDSTGRTPLIACAERSKEDWDLSSDDFFSVSGLERRQVGEEKKEGGEPAPSEGLPPKVDSQVHFGAQVASCLLTASPALVDAKDYASKSSALHYAVRRNDMQLVEALLKFQPDLNLQDGSGRTPLLIAAELNYNHLLGLLLKAGCDVNCKFPQHPNDPLVSYFGRKGLANNVKICIEFGAKDLANGEGKSCLDLASANAHFAKCTELLQSVGFKNSSSSEFQQAAAAELRRETSKEGQDGVGGGDGGDEIGQRKGFCGLLCCFRGKKVGNKGEAKEVAKEGVKDVVEGQDRDGAAATIEEVNVEGSSGEQGRASAETPDDTPDTK